MFFFFYKLHVFFIQVDVHIFGVPFEEHRLTAFPLFHLQPHRPDREYILVICAARGSKAQPSNHGFAVPQRRDDPVSALPAE